MEVLINTKLLYYHKDNIPKLFIKTLLERSQADGIFKHIFYGKKLPDITATVNLFTYPHNDFILIIHAHKLVGYMLLENQREHHAQAHFTAFREFWGSNLHEVFHETSQILLQDYNLLYGIIPKDNPHLGNFLVKGGMYPTGVLPQYFYNEFKKEYTDGLLYSVWRETTCPSEAPTQEAPATPL